MSRGARARLEQHAWPGNIRELRNVIERAALVCDGDEITEDDLQLGAAEPAASSSGSLHADVESLERKRILEALESCGGNQTRAAQQYGITRPRS